MDLFTEFPFIESERLIIKKIGIEDEAAVKALSMNDNVYRYEPTFLAERNCEDAAYFINTVCEKSFNEKESILAGIYLKEAGNAFCGIAEIFGCKKHTVSIGCRLNEAYWGKNIATEVVALLKAYLFEKTDIDTIRASNMIQNIASGRNLEKNGFCLEEKEVEDDWGYEGNVLVNKWCCKKKSSD